jgi:transcriptional regulator with XRE-family HTH domain
MTLTDMYEQLTGPLSVGKLLHAFRSTHEWSLEKLASKLSMSSSDLLKLENEVSFPDLDQTMNYAQILHEDQDFYVEIFLRDLLRRSGLDPSSYVKSLE